MSIRLIVCTSIRRSKETTSHSGTARDFQIDILAQAPQLRLERVTTTKRARSRDADALKVHSSRFPRQFTVYSSSLNDNLFGWSHCFLSHPRTYPRAHFGFHSILIPMEIYVHEGFANENVEGRKEAKFDRNDLRVVRQRKTAVKNQVGSPSLYFAE